MKLQREADMGQQLSYADQEREIQRLNELNMMEYEQKRKEFEAKKDKEMAIIRLKQ
jgi:hypothetical protein